jgi:O-antigen/teichoic acid export membrane protein
MRTAAEHDDGLDIIGKMASYFIFVSVLISLSLATSAHYLVKVIGVERYIAVADFIPIALIPYIFLILTSILGQGLLLAFKTQYYWVASLSQIVVTIVLGVLLLPTLGVYGAFLMKIGGTLTRLITAYGLSQKYMPIPFRCVQIAIILLGAVVAFAIASQIQVGSVILGLGVRGAVVLIYVFIMLVMLSKKVLVTDPEAPDVSLR